MSYLSGLSANTVFSQWVLMDDNKVTVAGVADVLRQDAYLLFYSLRSLRSDSKAK